MQYNINKNIFVYKFLSGLTPVGISKYCIYYVSFTPKNSQGDVFGFYNKGKFQEKLEGRIVIKAWKELASKFPICILGDYALAANKFSGIIMLDNWNETLNMNKYLPKILGYFKMRSSKLLNQFHGTHSKIFWENGYEEIKIDCIDTFNNAIEKLRESNQKY